MGDIEDRGRAPGLIRLYFDGNNPNTFGLVGLVEKSSIASLNMIPVDGDIIPKTKEILILYYSSVYHILFVVILVLSNCSNYLSQNIDW